MIPYNPIAGGLLSGKHARTGAAAGGHPLHPGHGGRDLPGAATGTTASSTPSRSCAPLADEAGVSLVTLAVAWVLANPADHRADHRGQPARSSSTTAWRPSDVTLDADLKRQLDEITHDYRMGDAPR